MTSDIVFNNEDEINRHTTTTRHFDVVQSEDDEDQPITSDDDNSPSATIETFDDKELNKLYDDWLALDAELREFEPKHKDYVGKLDTVESLKTKYRLEYDKYKKKLTQLQKDINQLKKSYSKKGMRTIFN
jgi:chromosome segregation ATPase